MGLSIEQLFAEADQLIEGREKTASDKAPSPELDDEVVKMANLLMEGSDIDPGSSINPPQPVVQERPIMEKVAEALAITEVLMNLNEYQKVAQFEKAAQEKGIPQEKIDSFISEKFASLKGKSLAKALTLPGAILGTGGAAGAAGFYAGKEKGKKKGYDTALEDVNKAFARYHAR